MPRILTLGLFLLLLTAPAVSAASPELPGDTEALAEVSDGRLMWDISEAEAMGLSNWLTVIRDTYEGLQRLDVRPHMVLVFRGKAVRLLTRDLAAVPLEEMGMIQEVHNKLDELRRLPRVRLEACNLSLRRQGMADKALVPGIKTVTNAFIAMAGYGAKGYTRIPVD